MTALAQDATIDSGSAPRRQHSLSRVEVDEVMAGIYARGDRMMSRFVFGHVLLSVAFAPIYDTWRVTAVWGGISALLWYLAVWAFPGRFFTRAMAGVVLESFCALHIWQMHGQPEQHFWFFVGFTMMIVYQDWLCMWAGALLIIGQHTIFAFLHNQGHNLHFFPEAHVSGLKLFFHFGIAVVHVGICGYWGWLLRTQTLRETSRQRDLASSRQALADQLAATERTATQLRRTEEELRQDILERERAERDSRDNRERLRVTLEAARMASWELDPETNEIRFAPGAAALVGHPLPRTLDQFVERVHPDDRAATRAAIHEATTAGTPFHFVFRVVCEERSAEWFASQGQLVPTAAGRPRQVLGVIADITERRRAEARHRQLELKVQQAQKLESLGVMAGGIAHDFNNLLVAILGNTNLLKDSVPEAFEDRPLLDAIEEASIRGANLTRQMLAYSGGGKFVVAAMDLSQVVRDSRPLLQSIVSKQARLVVDLADRLPLCEVDRNQVVQVLVNLVTNAAEALGDGSSESVTITTGRLEVDAEWLSHAQVGEEAPAGEYVFLRVADTGSGMSPETVARMFDPFFTTKFTGRGLGLAAVMGIVRSHDGVIRAESAIGRGTTITVLLPSSAAAPVERRPAISSNDPGWRGQGTVLVIDDEDAVTKIARRILERQGFATLGAADGFEGIQVFKQSHHEIVMVLVDKTMPGLSGSEVAERIAATRPEVPIVLTSGYDESASLKESRVDRFAAFIQKPYQATDLVAVVRQVLVEAGVLST